MRLSSSTRRLCLVGTKKRKSRKRRRRRVEKKFIWMCFHHCWRKNIITHERECQAGKSLRFLRWRRRGDNNISSSTFLDRWRKDFQFKMASPLNRQHRRTAPYVIMNNHSQPPSVAYSARSIPSTNNEQENGIRALADTPLQQPHQENLRSTISFFALVRRAQVCHIEFAFSFELSDFFFFKIFLQNVFSFVGVSFIVGHSSLFIVIV